MTDPRKQVNRPDGEQAEQVMDSVHAHLLHVTEVGSRNIGCTGASFVVMGMAAWMLELAELDGAATAKYFRALADLADPKTNDNQKRRAEKDRSQAVRALYAAVDLDMAEAKGNG